MTASRIFITGSSDGLGLLAGQWLAGRGHRVILHARSQARAEAARRALPAAERVIVGEVSALAEMKRVAEEAAAAAGCDAVIHNVAVGYQIARRVETVDGLEQHFAVNVLAPYVITAIMGPAVRRLVYLSSGLHREGDPRSLQDLQWQRRRWDGLQAYCDSKLHDVLLAFAVARRWPSVWANAIEPGWVATKMGGPEAPDDLELGARTQAWLAEGADVATQVSGEYWFHQQRWEVHEAARDERLQDALLEECRARSGVALS